MSRISFLIFIFIVCLLSPADGASIGMLSGDTTIAVVGYFCKGDTMNYHVDKISYEFHDNDTIKEKDYSYNFQIAVLDSTQGGYRMELQYSDFDFSKMKDYSYEKKILSGFSQLEHYKFYFTVGEYGNMLHLENWRSVRDRLYNISNVAIDSIYSHTDSLAQIMPRSSLMSFLGLQMDDESSVMQQLGELELLFGNHGQEFKIGKFSKSSSDLGYKTQNMMIAGYVEPVDPENDTKGDYRIFNGSEVTIPAKDVRDMGFTTMSTGGGDLVADKSLAETYFYIGWPKRVEYLEQAAFGGKTVKASQTIINWSERNFKGYINSTNLCN